MFLFRRTFTVLTIAILAMALALSVGCQAAKSKSTSKASVRVKAVKSTSSSGLSRVSVPAVMLKGSALTSGRAFYKSSVPEQTLGGIRLGRPANTILVRWGNPSRITLGTASAEVADITSPTGAGPIYIAPGALGSTGPTADLAGEMMNMHATALPRLPGMDFPGTSSPTGPETKMLSQEEVTWTYDLPNGITLEFIITDGTITQITVGGQGPWGLSKTRTGIQLGDSYKLVLWVCGFPSEPQKYVGRFLRVSYVDKNRALFTFLNKRLVGVTIAMVSDELRQ